MPLKSNTEAQAAKEKLSQMAKVLSPAHSTDGLCLHLP
jgi:hypothetical protein